MTQDTICREAQFKSKVYFQNYYDRKKTKQWFHDQWN